MITKKHYIEIARILNKYVKYKTYSRVIDAIVIDLCDYFKQDNEDFNIDKFKQAVFS